MKSKGKIFFILLTVVLGSVILSLIDGVIRPEYIIKTLSKLCIFPVATSLYFIIFKDERKHLRTMMLPSKKSIIFAMILGLGVFSVVMGAFLLLKGVIDFSAFTGNLTSTAGITANNFIFVSLYICILNSLMEELFFRALAFLSLKRQTGSTFAYIFSSAAFALYHTGMTAAFVAPWVFLLMVLGLFLGGCIFNFLDEKTESILPSWLCHLFANFATCSIGYMLLSQ